MDSLWSFVGPVIAPLTGVIVGGFLNFGLGVLKSNRDSVVAKKAKEEEAAARLKAIAELLWLDLGRNILLLQAAPDTTELLLDTSLWKDIRIEARRAGLDGRVTFNLMATYQIAETWNARLRESRFSRTPQPGVEKMVEAFQTTANLLKPFVSPELVAKVEPRPAA